MRLSRNAVQKAVAGVVIGSGLAVAGAAQAGMIYDLRFADGSHTQVAQAGQTYHLQLWVQVTGSDGNHANDALNSASDIEMLSNQASGGAITSGGLQNAALVAPWDGLNGSQVGTSSDLNGDGVIDWGSSSTGSGNTNYMIARPTGGAAQVAGGSVGLEVDANTWEYEIATFDFLAGTVGSGTTTISSVHPNVASFPAFSLLLGSIDGTSYKVTSGSGSASNPAWNNGVTFTAVPEPASLSLLGLGALGLLGRRRKGKKA